MLHTAYYEAAIQDFLLTKAEEIVGHLAAHHPMALERQQTNAWVEQIRVLKNGLGEFHRGHIYFEFSIPRMGKRADVVLLCAGRVWVIEFKIGADTFDRAAREQVHDYALDLKNFHRGSHTLPILPILIATKAAATRKIEIEWAADRVAAPVCIGPHDLSRLLSLNEVRESEPPIAPAPWSRSGYQPTPTIVEAAQALYRDHDIREIARSDAGARNLSQTTNCLSEIIELAKLQDTKAICFVTGVPGAGKTLAGLNIATTRASANPDEHAVFLSGNGPLVEVLREALARDQVQREKGPKTTAMRRVASFIQNIHHFRDEYLKHTAAPAERVVVFDEAQRAWNREQASRFMQQKRGYSSFDMSEPEFLVGVMDRHPGWCVVICLIGGGQEINTGEAGLAEWLQVVGERFPHWQVYSSHRLDDADYIWDADTAAALAAMKTERLPDLHLSVSLRSFRAESLSAFVGQIVDDQADVARQTYAQIAARYPIVVTRDLESAREWLRQQSRGSERYGLLAASGAHRLRPEGIFVREKIDAPTWFLNDRTDVRGSFYLEEAATEFDVQGLELDWTCVCWDADFRREGDGWGLHSFRGTRWQRVASAERQLYLKNAYRVLLTRARQGMVLFIPRGDPDDPTRPPAFYDTTFEYLRRCGLPELSRAAGSVAASG